MKSIAIGVHVHSQPARLFATLQSLRKHSPMASLILLPDGQDAVTSYRLRGLGMPQLDSSEPKGAAACFNRLAERTEADVIVFLESGCIAGPGWLEALLEALDASPQNGLAGPSTNQAWNEQCSFPGAGGSFDAIVKTARAAEQFRGEWKRLEPLHSLADFCYAVRRDVIDSIGGADESYGSGPCWEMDYNIRAARAGFRGVWARSSYVYRAPFTPRRIRQEREGFDSSKKRYQDKFCGLRLTGESCGYEPHCRGDACEHFAPQNLIQIKLPLGSPGSAPAPATRDSCAMQPGPEYPLVSCVMVTRDRPDFVEQSVRYFLRQDYPHRELIIVDDGAVDLSARIGADERIRYIRLHNHLSIGQRETMEASWRAAR
jgi:hypothetical protein